MVTIGFNCGESLTKMVPTYHYTLGIGSERGIGRLSTVLVAPPGGIGASAADRYIGHAKGGAIAKWMTIGEETYDIEESRVFACGLGLCV